MDVGTCCRACNRRAKCNERYPVSLEVGHQCPALDAVGVKSYIHCAIVRKSKAIVHSGLSKRADRHRVTECFFEELVEARVVVERPG